MTVSDAPGVASGNCPEPFGPLPSEVSLPPRGYVERTRLLNLRIGGLERPQQLGHCCTQDRVTRFGRQVDERTQHERTRVHARVRERQPFVGCNEVSAQQQVEIERARPLRDRPLATEVRLDSKTDGQQVTRLRKFPP